MFLGLDYDFLFDNWQLFLGVLEGELLVFRNIWVLLLANQEVPLLWQVLLNVLLFSFKQKFISSLFQGRSGWASGAARSSEIKGVHVIFTGRSNLLHNRLLEIDARCVTLRSQLKPWFMLRYLFKLRIVGSLVCLRVGLENFLILSGHLLLEVDSSSELLVLRRDLRQKLLLRLEAGLVHLVRKQELLNFSLSIRLLVEIIFAQVMLPLHQPVIL